MEATTKNKLFWRSGNTILSVGTNLQFYTKWQGLKVYFQILSFLRRSLLIVYVARWVTNCTLLTFVLLRGGKCPPKLIVVGGGGGRPTGYTIYHYNAVGTIMWELITSTRRMADSPSGWKRYCTRLWLWRTLGVVWANKDIRVVVALRHGGLSPITLWRFGAEAPSFMCLNSWQYLIGTRWREWCDLLSPTST